MNDIEGEEKELEYPAKPSNKVTVGTDNNFIKKMGERHQNEQYTPIVEYY